MPAVRLALVQVGRPPAGEEGGGMGVLVELEHRIDRAFEELPVVRDHHHAAPLLVDELLESLEPREVEIVGRLVEQGDVETGEDDRGQRHLRCLPTGEPSGRLLGEAGDAEVGQRCVDPCVHIPVGHRARTVPAPWRSEHRLWGGRFRDRRRPRPARPRPRRPRSAGASSWRTVSLGRWWCSWASRPTAAEGGSIRTVPESASTRPARTDRRVDLPTPLAPTTPTRAWGGTVSDTSRSTTLADRGRATGVGRRGSREVRVMRTRRLLSRGRTGRAPGSTHARRSYRSGPRVK